MTEEENKKLIENLGTSIDFIAALACAKRNIDASEGDTIDIRQIGLFFYHAGYMAAIDLMDKGIHEFFNKGKAQ